MHLLSSLRIFEDKKVDESLQIRIIIIVLVLSKIYTFHFFHSAFNIKFSLFDTNNIHVCDVFFSNKIIFNNSEVESENKL